MLRQQFIKEPYFAPTDIPVEDKALTNDDVVDYLGQDDNLEEASDKVIMDSLKQEMEEGDEDKDDKKKETKKGKAEDESKDESEDEPEVSQDDLELTTLPKRQEILKKFPDLFKTFPAIERAMYREKEYTELFTTPAEAKEVADRAEEFGKFEGEILKGNIAPIYKSLKEADPEGFKSLVDNLLPSLQKLDNEAYGWLVGDTIKRSVLTVYQQATANKNEELAKAAQAVYAFYFGNSKFELTPFSTRTGKTDNTEEEKLSAEREEFRREKYESVHNDLTNRVGNVLKATVNEYIDPKNEMLPYVRKNAINDVLGRIDSLLEDDARFIKIRDGLWEKAAKANFSQEAINKIRAAWLTQARTLLPGVIRSVRGEALKNRQTPQEDNRNRDVVKEKDVKTTRDRSTQKSDQKVPAGMKTLDFLMAD